MSTTDPYIFLIDDDEVSNYLAETILQTSGITNKFSVFKHAMAAVEAIENEWPDLILLDLNMPGLTGFEFLEICKKNYPKLIERIVILSSSTFEKDLTKASDYGVKKYLVKPLKKEDLKNIIKITFQNNNSE